MTARGFGMLLVLGTAGAFYGALYLAVKALFF